LSEAFIQPFPRLREPDLGHVPAVSFHRRAADVPVDAVVAHVQIILELYVQLRQGGDTGWVECVERPYNYIFEQFIKETTFSDM